MNGKPANIGEATPGEQLKSIIQSTIPQIPSSVAPPRGNQTPAAAAKSSQRAAAEASLRRETNSDGLVVVGKGARIVGEISNCSHVEIEGALEGDVIAATVIVRAGARLKGRVHSERIEVHGTAEGQIQVEDHLDIRSTGQVSGEIAYGKLSVAAGADLAGTVQRSSDLQREEPDAEALAPGSFANRFVPQPQT